MYIRIMPKKDTHNINVKPSVAAALLLILSGADLEEMLEGYRFPTARKVTT